MNKRYQIGIVGWEIGGNSFGTTKPYLSHLDYFGDVRILTPMEGIMTDLDLVVLPGGKDMPSFLYGEKPHFSTGDSDQCKEYFVFNNLQQYIDAGIPIWGTCLGMQQLIVKFGGRLCQNIPSSHGYSSEYRGELVNDLIFTPEYQHLEHKILAKRKSKSNKIKSCSLHHQGAFKEMVPECFNIVCHTDDKIVEVIEHKDLPIAGGQMHVEEDHNPVCNYLIAKLLKQSPNFKNEHTLSNSSLSD